MRDLLFGDVFVSVWHGILCFGCFDELNWKKCHSGMHSSLFCMVFCVLATPMSLAEKYGVADRARSLLLSSVKSCGDEKIDRGLMQASQGAWTRHNKGAEGAPTSVPSGATLTRRFGVLQKEKVRPINFYKANLVSSAVTQVDKFQL